MKKPDQNLNAVLPLVAAGVSVHLLRPLSKAPTESKWQKASSHTPETLLSSYEEGQNFGIRLGTPSKIGDLFLHALDLDIRKPEKADEARAALREFLPDFGKFPSVVSGSGGASRHIYFLASEAFRSRKIAKSEGTFVDAEGVKHYDWEIEIFGTGKQVACPPSIHPKTKKPYTWERKLDIDTIEMGLGPIVPADNVRKWASSEKKADEVSAKEPLDITLEEIKDTLSRLNVDAFCENREGWLKVGMALHHQFHADEDGYDLWCEFSQQSGKFNDEDQRRVWDSFSNRGDGATFASLLAETRASRMVDKFEAVEDDDDFFGVEKADVDDEVETLVAGLEGASGETEIDFNMCPVAPQDWTKIPRRQFIYGKTYIRKFVSAVVSPGGLGKSSMIMTEAMSMSLNEPLLRARTCGTKLNVLYSNIEDPIDEIMRRFAGIMSHYEITDPDLAARLHFTGRDTELSVAYETKTGLKFNRKTIRRVLDSLRAIKADVWIIDPFVSFHGLSENDNTKIDKVLKFLGRLAGLLDIAVCVIHHVRKPGATQTETTANDARGAGAFLAAVRSARVLNRMSKDDAKKIGISNPWAYFRVDDGKSNMAPPSSVAEWYHLASAELGNESDFGAGDGDSVGVVETWEPPAPTSGMSSTQTRAFLDIIAKGDWRADVRAGDDWAGVALAKVLDLSPVEDRSRLSAIIDDMLAQAILKAEERRDEKTRKAKQFLTVGTTKVAFVDEEDDVF